MSKIIARKELLLLFVTCTRQSLKTLIQAKLCIARPKRTKTTGLFTSILQRVLEGKLRHLRELFGDFPRQILAAFPSEEMWLAQIQCLHKTRNGHIREIRFQGGSQLIIPD